MGARPGLRLPRRRLGAGDRRARDPAAAPALRGARAAATSTARWSSASRPSAPSSCAASRASPTRSSQRSRSGARGSRRRSLRRCRIRSSGFSRARRCRSGRDARTASTSRSSAPGWTGAGTRLEDVDVRALAGVRGRARARAAPQARAGDDRRASWRRSAPSCGTRSGAERVPDASFAPRRPRRLPDAPRPHEVDGELDAFGGRRAARAAQPRAGRARLLGGLRSQEAVDLDLADVDFEQELVHVRGKGGKERVVPLGEEASHRLAVYLRDVAAAARARGRERALPLGARSPARHEHAAPAAPAPAPPAACLRDAPARGRRRPAHDPGAPRPQLALDDADVQPRGRAPPAQGLRPLAPAFLGLRICDIFIT